MSVAFVEAWIKSKSPIGTSGLKTTQMLHKNEACLDPLALFEDLEKVGLDLGLVGGRDGGEARVLVDLLDEEGEVAVVEEVRLLQTVVLVVVVGRPQGLSPGVVVSCRAIVRGRITFVCY